MADRFPTTAAVHGSCVTGTIAPTEQSGTTAVQLANDLARAEPWSNIAALFARSTLGPTVVLAIVR